MALLNKPSACRSRCNHTAFACFAASLAFACAARAQTFNIPIINPSFEDTSRPLAVGEHSNGAGGVGVQVSTRFPFMGNTASWANPVEVAGWRTRIIASPSTALVYAGAFNPPLLASPNGPRPFITGQAGQNVATIQIAQMGQTLNHTLMPATTYRLNFLGGIGLTDSDYFLAVTLIAVDNMSLLPLENQPGVQRLAISRNTPAIADAGTMLRYSMEYTTPAILPSNLQGKFLGIHLWGSDGIPRVVYDDFSLTATPIPAPGVGALIAAFAVGASRRRRG